LIVDETIEAALTEGSMVPGELDYRFGFTLRAVHGGAGLGQG
jgi:hypothetical protein